MSFGPLSGISLLLFFNMIRAINWALTIDKTDRYDIIDLLNRLSFDQNINYHFYRNIFKFNIINVLGLLSAIIVLSGRPDLMSC